MRIFYLAPLALCATLLGASSCISSLTSSPVTTAGNAANTALVAAAEAVTAADQTAALYVKLPLCGAPTSPPLCSVAATSAKIKSIAAQANSDLLAAQAGTVSVETVLKDVTSLTATIPAS